MAGSRRAGLVVSVWMALIVLVAVFGAVLNVPVVRASGTIYIRADGSIDPPDAPISTVDNVTYTLTDNTTSDTSGIVVERSNIIIDGNGQTLQGMSSADSAYRGIYLSEVSNVTIKKTNIKGFGIGIGLISHYNTIFGNNITNNNDGIAFDYRISVFGYPSYNVISQNNIANNCYSGINVVGSDNTITENDLINNGYGIVTSEWVSCYGNKIYHNNFLWNTEQVIGFDSRNTWDDGYPSGGNYWSDHIGADEKNGPNQDQPGSDRIADTPYFSDRYPLMSPSPPPLHELALNLKAPKRLPHGVLTSIKATVSNIGFSKEENITISWFINETIVNLTTISLLEVLSSSTINYVWTPMIECQYNVTAYVTPVLGETHVANNRRTTFVTVGKSPVKNINTDLYYVTIQGAIDAPETLDGHTIQAEAETYYEHLTISKSLNIIGEDYTNTIIDGSKTGTFLVHITANNVALSGFTIQNSSAAPTPAIRIDSSNNVISNNMIINNGWGVYVFGGSNNTIENCIVSNNVYGVTVQSEGEVTIEKNEILGNSEGGVSAVGKSNVLIKENTIKQNKNGIATDASSTHSGIIIVSNIISYNQEDGINLYSYGEGGYYGPAGYAYINDVIISSNIVSCNQRDGINLQSYGYNRASMSGFGYGYVHNVSITSNDISGNGRNGIYIYSHGYGEGWAYSVYTGKGWGYGYIYGVTIDFNNITSNGDNGVYAYGYGYGFGEADRFGTGYGFGYIYDLSFSSNIFSSNCGDGVYIYSCGEASGAGSLSSSGYGRGRIYNVAIHSNSVLNNSGDGIHLYTYGKGMGSGEGWGYIFNVAISKNTVSFNHENGLNLKASHHNVESVYDIGISKNMVSANYQKGVWIDGGINANSTRNSVLNNTYGVFYSTTTNNLANYNNICRNFYGMNVTDGATVNAEYNYWGDPSGPHHESLNPDGDGNPVNGNGLDLDFMPYSTNPQLMVFLTLNSTSTSPGGYVLLNAYVTNDTDPVEDVLVQFVSDKGGTSSPSSGYTDLNGNFAAIFAPPTVTKWTSVEITVTASKTGHMDDFDFGHVLVILPDFTPPATSISLSGVPGRGGWFTSDVMVTLFVTDDVSGVYKTEYSPDNATWTIYTSPFYVTIEGNITLCYRSTDMAGNIEEIESQHVGIDKTVPSGLIIISNDDAYTTSTSVTLTLTATDLTSGVYQGRCSNDGVWDTEPWKTFSPTRTWTLTSGDGTKTVYFQIKDNAGLISETYADTIVLDATIPHIETPSREPAGDVQPDQSVKVSANVTDALSGVKNVTLYYSLNNGTTWEEPTLMNLNPSTGFYEATIPKQPAGTWVEYKIIAYDYAGNNATLDGIQPYCVYQVVAEILSSLVLPIFMIITLLAAIAYKRKRPPL